MFNIVLSDKVINDIDNFIDSYKKIFLDRFFDTWIFNEELIRNNYIEISKEFRNNIYDKINKWLISEQNLWRMIIKKDLFSLFINVWNYKILLSYKEDNIEKIRFIEDISFYKK